MQTNTQSTTRAAFNAALMAAASPHLVGCYDAEHGNGDQALDRYTKAGDILEYREGYNETRLAQAQERENRRAAVMERKPRMLTAAEMMEATIDYEWDMYDRERHSRGAW